MKPRTEAAERGFALLAALWILIGLSLLAAAAGELAYRTVGVSQREHDRLSGRWLAEGCLERVRAVADQVMAHSPDNAGMEWRSIDRIVLVDSSGLIAGCDLSFHTDGRIVIEHATEAELNSLPGMTPEAVAKIEQILMTSAPINDLLSIEGLLSPEAKAAFDAQYFDLTRHATLEPDAWIVRSRAHLGEPPTPVNIEVRLVRGGTRATVVRWVEW